MPAYLLHIVNGRAANLILCLINVCHSFVLFPVEHQIFYCISIWNIFERSCTSYVRWNAYVRCLGTAVIFKTCISSAKLPRGYPGNMSDLYFRFANLYLNVLRIIYLPKCLLSLSFLN